MALEGVQAVQARISEITARFGVRAPASSAASGAGAPSFATALDVAKASAPGSDFATRRPAGAYGRTVPPAELQAYGNGKIPAAALSRVGDTGHKLWAPAARALERLMADAAASGVRIGITDSYRSFDSQVDVARRRGLYQNGGLAAVPGTSAHGWGMATDHDLDASALEWMRENAHKYGFVEDTPREPWHWGYRPDRLAQ